MTFGDGAARTGPIDRILFRGERVTIANFSVTPESPRFTKPEPIARQIVVFPRLPVGITQGVGMSVVADPSVVTLYLAGTHYRRDAVRGGSDRCDWFALTDEALAQVTGRDVSSARRILATGVYPCPPRLYAAQRRIVRHLEVWGDSIDRSAVEESALAVLSLLFETPAPEPSPRDWLVTRAKRRILEEIGDSLSLTRLAEAFGCSTEYLSRSFREVTGSTFSGYRRSVRLGLALERLDGGSLSSLAADLGFSSHSHFTECFRTTFGSTPSRFRELSRALPRPGRSIA